MSDKAEFVILLMADLEWLIVIVIIIIIFNFLYLGGSSRGGRQKLIPEIITLMVSHPSGSHQQSSCAAG